MKYGAVQKSCQWGFPGTTLKAYLLSLSLGSLRSWRYCWVSRAQAKAAKPRQRAAQPRVAWGGEAEIPPARMGCFFGFNPLICILTN